MSNITNKTIISKMKRFTLLAALGLCSISLFAQDAQKEEPKEEGFVFTTVKEPVSYTHLTLPTILRV